ncbi:MAG: hypothetical protein HY903_22535 [Deltaproteobacteria bacterium]|nr:hypothetical protein [Deltaproteobacteria bacterium]
MLHRRHHHHWLATGAAVVAALSVAATAEAAELTAPAARQGYYLGGGVNGVAVRSVDRDLGAFAAAYGSSYALRVGEMLTPWLGIGLEVGFGQAQSSRWRSQFGGLLLDAQANVWKNLALHAMAGLGAVMARDKLGRVASAKGTGGALYGAGIGYDFFPLHTEGSGGFGITPSLQGRYCPGSSFHAAMVWVGLDLYWWRGLDKQELELPAAEAFTGKKQG